MVSLFEQLKQTFANKKVFLTGHTGFKGAWMLKTLHMLGAEVKGYALAPQTNQDIYHLIKGDQICSSVIADIRNANQLHAALNSFEPDFVFHLAAQPLVRYSYKNPLETFEVNTLGTAYLLDAVKSYPKKCTVVVITTDKVYDNKEWIYPYRENDRLGGYDPYSSSKACAELIIESYKKSFFNPQQHATHQKAIAVARAGNVIGGGDWSQDRLVPDIVRALSQNKTITLRNPHATRPWQHVMEPIVGYLELAKQLEEQPLKFNEAYNFGPYTQDNLTVQEMVAFAIQCWGQGNYVVEQNDSQPHEAGLLRLDISKVIHQLAWKPLFHAQEAIEYTIDWYKNFFEQPADIATYTEQQIARFLDASK